jgi:outer membrane lipopolysaccharide assembly protein LptE/RlpB
MGMTKERYKSRRAPEPGTPVALPWGLLVLVFLLCSSCGVYSTTPGSLPGHIKTISIPTFENLTNEVNLEQEVSHAVVDRFVADNNLRVVNEAEADAVLTGAVIGYKNAIFGFTANVVAEEYRVSVTVSVKLFDKVKNREIWRDENMIKTWNYYVQDVPGQVAQDERTGRSEAILKIADEILSKTVDTW